MINQQLSMKHKVMQGTGTIVSDMNGEKVMLSVTRGKYYNLGEIGGDIWTLMKEPITLNDLVTTLQTKYEVERTVCENQVLDFIEGLLKEELIVVKE